MAQAALEESPLRGRLLRGGRFYLTGVSALRRTVFRKVEIRFQIAHLPRGERRPSPPRNKGGYPRGESNSSLRGGGERRLESQMTTRSGIATSRVEVSRRSC